MGGHPDVTATFTTGERTAQTPDIMTTFSSRGPLGDWIKPDITAPGIEILAGRSPHPTSVAIASGPPGDDFMAIAGTSMSAPHATGVAALVKAAHPTWTPGQIKSAMMTSSVQSVLQPDGVTPANPFNTGAGSIRADRAVAPVVVFDETAADYAALGLGSAPPHRREPSEHQRADVRREHLDDAFVHEREREFTAADLVTTSAPAGASISVDQSKFGMDPGQTKTLTITITGEGLAPNSQYFGSIKLDPKAAGANDIYLPVAFFTRQGDVTLTQTCTPGSIAVNASSTCTVTAQNFSPSDAANNDQRDDPEPLEPAAQQRAGGPRPGVDHEPPGEWGERLHLERDARRLDRPDDRLDHAGWDAGGRVPAASASSGSRRSQGWATRRSRTSTSPRSRGAARSTRGSAWIRTGT